MSVQGTDLEPEFAREVITESSADELATRVAGDAAARLRHAVSERESAHLVVTGGGILESVLTALKEQDVPWEHVHVWWGDERYVDAASDDRNDRAARAALFDSTDAQLHPMPSADAGFDSAEDAADAYQSELSNFGAILPRFDVVLLGIGPDGHCASLFPDHEGTRTVGRSVIAVHDSPKPPPDRLSLTFSGLHEAAEVWVIASGAGKAKAVAESLTPGVDPFQVPARGANGQERTVWYLDAEAAATYEQDERDRAKLRDEDAAPAEDQATN